MPPSFDPARNGSSNASPRWAASERGRGSVSDHEDPDADIPADAILLSDDAAEGVESALRDVEEARDGGNSPDAHKPPPTESKDARGNFATHPPIQIYAAESIIEQVDLVEEHSLPVRFWLGSCRVIEWLFGVVCMLIGLAVLASIPIVQFFSLGYLLEASGRISRSGRLRAGFIGVRSAARVGSLLLGTWIVLLPAQFASQMWASARLIDPASGVAAGWRIGLFMITGLVVAHVVLAWYCGGKFRHFFWPVLAPLFFLTWTVRRIVASDAMRPLIAPWVGKISPRLLHDLTTVPALTEWFPPAIFLAGIKRGGLFEPARDAVWDFATGLRPQYYFWLGLRGFAGAFAWLLVPTILMMATTKLELADANAARGLGALAGLAGTFLLAGVLLYLPFLQAHFAAERRFRAFLEIGRVRQLFRQAPVALTFGLLITLAFALPLYLLKIETVPSELLWALSLVFVAFGFPARLAMGWAMGRARRREAPRHFLSRWLASLVELPIIGFYVFFVYFTQYYVWNGAWSLFEQHAFLPPVPFLGLLGG